MSVAEGWEALDELDRATDAAVRQKSDELRAVYRSIKNVCESPDGQVMMAALRAKTIESPAFYPGKPHSADTGFMREGENNIYRWLLRCCKRANAQQKEDSPNAL